MNDPAQITVAISSIAFFTIVFLFLLIAAGIFMGFCISCLLDYVLSTIRGYLDKRQRQSLSHRIKMPVDHPDFEKMVKDFIEEENAGK